MKSFIFLFWVVLFFGSCTPNFNQVDIILLDVSPSRTDFANKISINSAVLSDSSPGVRKVICFVGATPDQSILEIDYPAELNLDKVRLLEKVKKGAEDSLLSYSKNFIEKKENFSNIIESSVKCVKKYKSLFPFAKIRLIIYSDGVVEESSFIDLNHALVDKFPNSYKEDLTSIKGIEMQLRTFTNSSEYTVFSNRLDFNKIERFWQDFASKKGINLTYIGSSKDFK